MSVIIEGFDELLKTSSREKTEELFNDAEPILETIAELVKGDAKVLSTTCRTAIFIYDDFSAWVAKNVGDFTFRRYNLTNPIIADWIDSTRKNIEECWI